MRGRILVIAGALFSVAASTESGSRESQAAMRRMLSHLLALQPLMVSPEAFIAPANETVIRKHLDSLAQEAGAIDHYTDLQTPGYAISATLLAEHTRETSHAFNAGMPSSARWMLNELLQGCIGCHSQRGVGETAFLVDPNDLSGPDMKRADFLYATHQFDQALALYDKVVAEFVPVPSSDPLTVEGTIEDALRRKLAIFLRVRRDPAAAISSLQADLAGNSRLPEDIRDLMKRWIVELRRPALLPSFDPATVRREELEPYVHAILADDLSGPNLFVDPARAAGYLVLSGVLYDVLAGRHAGLSRSQLLFWLAKCDETLDRDPFFSLSTLYLQQCISSAPHTPIAKLCFHELSGRTMLDFSGSGGIDLPPDVIRMLAMFEAESR